LLIQHYYLIFKSFALVVQKLYNETIPSPKHQTTHKDRRKEESERFLGTDMFGYRLGLERVGGYKLRLLADYRLVLRLFGLEVAD
jgi:mRNA-degrading endonuclease RelE of RelBE toxin-antitoxin system